MSRVKTLFMYAAWVVIFIIFSEFLINVSLNSTYKPIERKDNIEEIKIYQAEATMVNGRIRGLITNSDDDLSGKYLEFSFYSKRDTFMGRKFIDIKELKKDETQNFEILFKLKDVDYYSVSILENKPDLEEIEIIPKEWTKPEIMLATALTFLILW